LFPFSLLDPYRDSGLMLLGSRSMIRQYSRPAGTTQASLFHARCPKPDPVAASGGPKYPFSAPAGLILDSLIT
jgi:hypothetical protein